MYNHFFRDIYDTADEIHKQNDIVQKLRKFFVWLYNDTNISIETKQYETTDILLERVAAIYDERYKRALCGSEKKNFFNHVWNLETSLLELKLIKTYVHRQENNEVSIRITNDRHKDLSIYTRNNEL